MQTKLYIKIIALLLVIATLFSLVACDTSGNPTSSDKPSWLNPSLSDPNENTLQEDHITEDIINEIIITESYLVELVEVENKISELLLAEDMINEVILCKTIYIPQEHIEEFADNSQTEQLFGEGIDLKALATKIAIGTGLIITTVVLTKVGIPQPIVDVVIKPMATETMKLAASGAVIGSVYGGLTGALDEVDESKKLSAIVGVAAALAGLIISTVSLIAIIPSGGASSIGVFTGIQIGISAVFALSAAAGTVSAGINAIKTFKATDSQNIDWNNIDWDKVGVSAAEQAINNSADGFMWGSIAGVVQGGAKGLANYEKYYAPYSKYIANDGDTTHYKQTRMGNVPSENSTKGKWSGARGESDFILNEPIVCKDGTIIDKVSYKNAIPDFSPYQYAKVKITQMTDDRYKKGGNFDQADEALAKIWTKSKHMDKEWTAKDVADYRESNHLTWHEMNNMEYMQLVPTEVNSTFTHLGGCSEYRIMKGQEGGVIYD